MTYFLLSLAVALTVTDMLLTMWGILEFVGREGNKVTLKFMDKFGRWKGLFIKTALIDFGVIVFVLALPYPDWFVHATLAGSALMNGKGAHSWVKPLRRNYG